MSEWYKVGREGSGRLRRQDCTLHYSLRQGNTVICNKEGLPFFCSFFGGGGEIGSLSTG